MKIKIIKGLLIIALGLLFLTVKFYNINSTITVETGVWYIRDLFNLFTQHSKEGFELVFNQFFQSTGLNVVIGLLFIVIGVFEIIEAKGVKTNVN
jgi:mannitol-specific phosphotransferase system IIBC component